MWELIPQIAPGHDLYVKYLAEGRDAALFAGSPGPETVDYLGFTFLSKKDIKHFFHYFFDDGFLLPRPRGVFRPQKILSIRAFEGFNLRSHFDELKQQVPALERGLENCLANLRWPTEEEIDQLPELARELGL